MDAELIGRNVRHVRDRIARAAERARRDPSSVGLIAAAKTMPTAAVHAAVEAGVTDIGHNYVQEAVAMVGQVSAPVRWHLIGHLQRNKAAKSAATFDVVQTVDSPGLGEALSRAASKAGRVLSVLVEVNVGGEASKSGVAPEDAAGLVDALRANAGLTVDGLMAIPPPADETQARRYFRQLRDLSEELGLAQLSMGMTNDFEIAIEEGATMVRVGRAIFGERG